MQGRANVIRGNAASVATSVGNPPTTTRETTGPTSNYLVQVSRAIFETEPS